MKPKIDTIIFDFDGVIVDSGADIANAVLYTLQYFGRPLLPREEIISYVGHGMESLIQRSFKDCGKEVISRAIPVYKKRYLDNAIVETRLYDNVKYTLEFFKQKNIGVVTNKPEDLAYKILEGLGVRDYFKIIVGPESVKNMKPDPEGLLKVISHFGGQPDKTIMVGDSYTDVQAGRRAGTMTCGVTYGLGDTEELKKESPDFLIDDMKELTDIIV